MAPAAAEPAADVASDAADLATEEATEAAEAATEVATEAIEPAAEVATEAMLPPLLVRLLNSDAAASVCVSGGVECKSMRAYLWM